MTQQQPSTAGDRLTVERLFSEPPLIGRLPVDPGFTPDGGAVVYLRTASDDRERQDLWRHDIASGSTSCWLSGEQLESATSMLSDAEKAERERRRQFTHGINRYAFSTDGSHLLIPAGGAAYVMKLSDEILRCVTPHGTRQTDIRFAPSAQYLSYVRDGDLYVCDLTSGQETRLTHDGGDTITNGIAEFIAQEEMHRFEGHWWSSDSRWLAYTRVDESPVAISQRYEIDADEIRVIPQRYPYAGATNANVELKVIDPLSGASIDIDWRWDVDDYLARVNWWGQRLVVQSQARNQQRLSVRVFDLHSGAATELFQESHPCWLNLHDNFRPIDDAGFLWTSERTGSSQLYFWRDGELRQLTEGPGRINRILWADAGHAIVQGWYHNATEQHAYRVELGSAAPQQPQRITHEAGWHDVVVSRDGSRLLDRHTAIQTTGALRLLTYTRPWAADDPKSTVIADDRITADHPYYRFRSAHSEPVLGQLTAEDGQLLNYRLTRPQGPKSSRHPVIVSVYGGPGVQRVRNEWPPLLVQLFAQHGYGVLELDNRGSGNRERAFETAIYGQLGEIEVRDQIRGVEFLRGLDWVDPARIGVFGHSYGGYMAIMCLLKAPSAFRAAVSVAPVSDWGLYDTHYTERYLATPASNADGYAKSAVFPYLDGMAGKLLLIHGMADDNVLYTHSTRLYRELQARNLSFEMMAYPGSKHALQERDVSIHRFHLILDFFGRNV